MAIFCNSQASVTLTLTLDDLVIWRTIVYLPLTSILLKFR